MKKNANSKSLGFALLLLAGLFGWLFLFSPPEAQAIQIKKVQAGVLDFDTNTGTNAATIAQALADPAKTFVLIYPRHSTNVTYGDHSEMFSASIDDISDLTIMRGDTGSYDRTHWFLAEFADGVRVINGSTTMLNTTYSKTINHGQNVNINKSFVIIYSRGGYPGNTITNVTPGFLAVATLPDANNITIDRKTNGGRTASVTFDYQIVECSTDVTIKNGTTSIPGTSTTVDVTLGTAITNINKTFLIFQYTGGASYPVNTGIKGKIFTRGNIVNTTTLRFYRDTVGANANEAIAISWWLVELTDPVSLVQKNAAGTPANFVAYSGTMPQSLAVGLGTTIDSTRGVPILRGTSPTSNAGNIYEMMVGADLSNTTLTLRRLCNAGAEPGGASGAMTQANVDWFVTEFCPVTLTSPNGGEIWPIGSTKTITWKFADALKTGGTGTGGKHRMKLEFSPNGGTTYYQIVNNIDVSSDATNTGTYSWTIPPSYTAVSTISQNCKIKITDNDLALRNYDESNAAFTVNAAVTIVQPPNSWLIGQAQNVTWSYKGLVSTLSPSTVTLESSADGGSTWDTINATASVGADGDGTNGSGSYSWTIPSDDPATHTKNYIGTNKQVRITLNYNPVNPNTLVISTSTNFTLTGQISNVTPTAASQTWLLGENHTLTWSKKGHFGTGVTDGFVNILYSNNSGASFDYTIMSHQAAGTDAAGGSYSWTVPTNGSIPVSSPSSQIRVENEADGNVGAQSQIFTLQPSFDLLAPLNNDLMRFGSTYDVSWKPHGTFNYVVIKYSVDAGSTWNYLPGAAAANHLAAGAPESTQHFSWQIANPIGLAAKLRVCKNDNAGDEDTVYKEVTVNLKSVITVTSPSVGASVEVTHAGVGNTQLISWSYLGSLPSGAKADISVSFDGNTFTDISTNTVDINNGGGNSGTYAWTVTAAQIGITKVRVAWHGDSDQSVATGSAGASAAFKTIPYLRLTTPNSVGLSYTLGNTVGVQWTPDPLDSSWQIGVRYSNNSGSTYTGFITDNVNANNSIGGGNYGYNWTIPDVSGIVKDTMRIQIFQMGKLADVHQESNYDFSIKGTITLTGEANGVGSPVWLIANQPNITWHVVGDIGNVNILYAKDGTNFNDSITSNFPITGTANYNYAWTIPGSAITGDQNINIKIKVTNTRGTDSAPSANPITIRAKIDTVTPSGATTTVFVEDNAPITWKNYYSANIPNVVLKYDTGAGTFPYDINGGNSISNPLDSGSFGLWQVPNAIGNNVKVRIASAVNPSLVYGQSDNPFKIKGKLNITAPTAANVGVNALKVNSASLPSTFTILWRNCGDIGATDNFYFSANGQPYFLVGTLTGANGNQSSGWQPPDIWHGTNTIGATNKIKITNPADETIVYKESDNFEIKGQLAITSPTNGQVYAVGGTAIPVTWNYAGALGNIDIWFSSDGTNWQKMDTVDAGYTQPYNLAVPNSPTSTAYIKIQQVTDATITSTSSAFRIRGDIKNVQIYNTPWKVNNVNLNRITWDRTGAIANVEIKLDTQSGTGGFPISVANSTPNSGEFFWNIDPSAYVSATSDTCRIRVMDANDTSVLAVNSSDFAIKPVIWLTHPQSQADSWVYNISQNIQWDYLGAITNVRLQFSDDNGATWPVTDPYLIATTANASAKSYSWTVPDKMSGQCIMRISKFGDTGVTDDSDSAFRIKPALSLAQPAGGAIRANTSYSVQWNTIGTLRPLGTVKLEYSLDNGSNWNAIVGAGSLASPSGLSSYSWSIPDQSSAAALVRVTSNDDSLVTAQSTSSFSLRKLNLMTPNGGEHWAAHTSQSITWTAEQVGTVRAWYSIDGGSNYTLINTASGAAGSLAWTIADLQTVSQNCKVKLEDLNYNNIYNVSAAPFDIKEYLKVTDPINGAAVTATDPYSITWDKYGTGVTSVILEYSKDGGTNWNYVNPVNPYTVGNSGSYLWTVPADALSNQAQIRITDPGNVNARDTGNNFWIKSQITVSTPSGSESWNVGSNQNIAWTKKGNIPLVNIYYSGDNGSTWSPIGSGVSGTSPWSWNILGSTSLTVLGKIKIEDAAFPTVTGISSNNFEVKGNIYNVVVTPLSGGILNYTGPASSFNVSWDYLGAIATVQVYYSIDGGVTYPGGNLLGEVSAALKPATFTIPNAIGTNLKIKVAAKSNPNVYGESGVFAIKGSIHLEAPNGPEAWTKGSTQQVLWTPTGTYPGNVLVEYSANGGTNWNTIATKAAGNDGVQQSQNWLIPDVIGITNLVRVTTQVNATIDVTDSSDAQFKIKGNIVLSAPNGGNIWNVGETTRNITWTSTGTVTPVLIEYSINAGGSWSELTHTFVGVEGANSYSWNPIPDKKSEQCLVRVSDNRTDFKAITTATSAANFSIRPQITVATPATAANVPAASSGNPLRWTITGTQVTWVNIESSIDAGAWTTIENNVDASRGTNYAWNGVPAQKSSNVKIRVYDKDNTNIEGQTGVFNIVGNLQITSPTGSPREHWTVGASHNITWTSSAVNTVKAYYSIDGGTNWNYINSAAGLGGTMAWAIADNQQVSNNAKVKITDQDNEPVTYSISASAFDIIAVFDITHPENGDTVIAKDGYTISWTNKGIGVNNVILEYSIDGGTNWNYVNPVNPYTVSNSTSYNWPSVPETALSPNCKIKITDPNNSFATDTGAGVFWIQGQITVTSPNDGTEAWGVGTSHNITWTKKGNIATVDIYYSTDSGATWGGAPIASGVSAAGTYSWNILTSTTLTTHGRIKVADSAYVNIVKGSSANDFKIQGTLSLQQPTLVGIVMNYGGSPYNITWNRFGAIATVKLVYSTDGGVTYPEPANIIITGKDASALSFAWTVPNKIGTNLKVKIIDENNATVWDQSANTFSIKGAIHLDQPNGTEVWLKGSTQQVLWTPTGTYSGNVLIEYSTNGGTSWNTIATKAAGNDTVQQSQNWLIPDAIGITNLVRVTTVVDPGIDVTDQSDAPFKIRGNIVLSAPNGGNVWYVGETTRNITWTSTGTVTPVLIEYSTDNGGSWSELTHTFVGVEGANSYAWNPVPNEKSEQCLVRVSDNRTAFKAITTATSAAVFSIRPQITVATPATAANVPAASNGNALRWSITGSKVTWVNIEYSINAGAWTTIQNHVDASQGTTYVWNGVPAQTSSNVKIRVYDQDDTNVEGDSGIFNIVGNLQITSPKGSPREHWTVGASHNITWTSSAVNTVKAYISLDGGATFPTFIGSAAGLGGSMAWAIDPAQQVSNNAKVKITDQDNESVVSSISPAAFDIIATFDITHPENGDTVVAKDGYTISWTKQGLGVNNVILEYSIDGGTNWNYVNPVNPYTVSNSGSYNWPSVPETALSANCKIKITDPNNSFATDTGAGVFWIQGQITVTSPNDGTEAWGVGTSHNITWTKKGNIATVDIYYSTDSGATWGGTPIASGVSGAGTYNWSIPDTTTLTTHGRIKVADSAYVSIVKGSSANDFKIQGTLSLTAPTLTGIVMIYGGAPYTITWNKFGAIATVKLVYSTDGGVTYPEPGNTITTGRDASTQNFAWTVPNKIGINLKVKIIDENNATVWDQSANTFSIKGAIHVDQPNGPETWIKGTTQQIRWIPTGTYASTVKIEYSTNGLAGPWTQIATPAAGNDTVQQSQNWQIPDQIGTDVRVRISTQLNALIDVVDSSDASFMIRGDITLNNPNGANIWYVGETNRSIDWSATGTVTPVKIEYSTDNGGSWNELTHTFVGAEGSNTYPWNPVPNLKSEQCLVRVSDARGPFGSIVTSTSAAVFSIRPQITVTAPAAAANVPAASNGNPLRWTITGSPSKVNFVKLEYSIDGGAWQTIAASVDASHGNTYVWDGVPASRSSNVRVQVTDTENAFVTAVSGVFNIVGNLNLSSPTGSPRERWQVGASHNITWTSAAVNTVKAYISLDGGVTFPTLIGSAAGSGGTMAWAIADNQQVSNNAKIKITDQDNENVVYSISPLPFDIIAVFDVTHPENGDVLTAEDPYLIQWTKKGSGVTDIILEYSTDGGAHYSYVNPVSPFTVPNSGNYSWPAAVGTVLSYDCKMKVSDPNNANAVDVGAGQFRIKGLINIVIPNGGESWGAGSSHDITWSKKGNIATVIIEYSSNDGQAGTWSTIGSGVSASPLKLTWNIPAGVTLTTTGKIKITSEGEPDVTSMTAGHLELKGNVILNTPTAAGIALAVGDTYNITWTRYGSVTNVDIFLSTNGVSYPMTPFITVPAASGTYPWTIPDSIGKTCKIKVQDSSNNTVWSESANNFEIKGKVVLSVPAAGAKWFYNEAAQILWTPTGTYTLVKLEYSTDNFVTATTIDQVNAGVSGVQQNYNWASVSIPVSETAKIRVSDPNSPTVAASSPDFSVRGRLTIIAPNGPEVWTVDAKQDITWNTKGNIPNVDLSYSTDGTTYTSIVSNRANAGTYNWTIPNAVSDNVTVKVADSRYPTDVQVSTVSAAPFKIVAGINLTSPIGNENWAVGSNHSVTWTPHGDIPTVEIRYSDDGGLTYLYQVVASTSGNTGSYNWTNIPNNTKTTCKVKVMDTRKPTLVFDVSPQTFNIVGSLTLTHPAPGDSWPVGQQKEITWTTNGTIARVKVQLSLDGGTSYEQITDNASGGSYFWDIPLNKCTPNGVVKLIDFSNPNVFNIMAGTFKLQAQFGFTNPLAGQPYTVNDNCAITWGTIGNVPNVRLEYKRGTDSWVDILASVGNSGSYNWQVPDAIGDSVIVRVSDTRDYSAQMDSGVFRIHGALLLTQPGSSTVWTAETPVTINWNVTGSIAFVDLFYSPDAGLSYPTTIAAGVIANNKTINWTAPQHVVTNQARVKIAQQGNATVLNESPVFTVRGSVHVASPNLVTDQWEAGTPHNITWTRTGDFANVKITLSNNSGGSFNFDTIAATWGAASGTYSWGIPNDYTLGTHFRVRIADLADETNVYDDSDNDFGINGVLTLTVPSAGATWFVGDSQDIRWTRQGSIAYVGLDISTNAFSNESQTFVINAQTDATGTPAGSYKYTWSIGAVPDLIGTNLKVRVKDYSNPTNVYSVSVVPFTIKGFLTLNYPNGNSTLVADDSLVILWTPRGNIPTVKLEYSINGGSSYDYTIVGSTNGMTGSYATTVPSVIGSLIKIRVSDTVANRSQSDDSDANFTVKGKLTLTSPVTLVSWQVGTQHSITWNRNGPIQNVSIDYTTDGWATSNPIVALTNAAAGSYTWTIPQVISTTTRVKVSDALDPSVYSISPVDFKLVGIIGVTAPTAASRWEVGLPQNIIWTKTGPVANVKIDYSKDNGVTWSNIVPSVSGTQSSWTPGNNDVSTTAKIRVADATDATVNDVSAAFHVKARFTVSSPGLGNVWPVNSAQTLSWSTIGTVSTVKLDYSKDNGVTWVNIAPSVANSGSYAWTVPNAISITCFVRVSDLNDSEAVGVSGAFKIRGDIALIQPTALGISWTVDSTQQIIWTTTGTLSTVIIQYTYDGESTWNNIATGINATAGTPYSWTVPDHLSQICKVKVISEDDSMVFAQSANNFTIQGQLAVSSPVATDTWRVNGSGTIQWSRLHGNIQYVNIDYSTNGPTGPFAHPIAANVLASNGTYDCAVADTISDTVVVRVSDRDNPAVYALSQQFKIKGRLALTRPIGNERFVYNTVEPINWNLDGNISTITLRYTTDNGTTYNMINNAVNASNKTFNWTVPNNLSNNVKVRISDNGDPSNVYDMSPLAFKIVGVLVLNSPGGGEVWPVSSTQSVSWSTGGSSVQRIRIEYSTDRGSTYPPENLIADNVLASDGTKSFTVADTLSPNVVVRISDTSESSVFAESSKVTPIKIRGDLVVTRPIETDAFLLDSTEQIRWTRYGSIPAAKIEYSSDGGTNWVTIANSVAHIAGANQSWNWGPVPNPPTLQAKIRVSVVGDPTVYSASPLFVVRGGFKITVPNTGLESWAVGTQQNINWQTYGSYGNVKLYYSTDNGATWNLVIGSTPNSNTYAWTVADAISNQCLIRVQDIVDSLARDDSDVPFKIHGVLNMVSPVGGEKWGVSSSQPVRWTKTGTISTVKLEYSTNGFSDESQTTLINDNVPSGGANPSYSWTIPDRIGNDVKVRVSSASDSTVNSVSPDPFTIRGNIIVSSPNGGENWISNSTHNIVWTTQGSILRVNLDYSTNGGTSWQNIVMDIVNASPYNWSLPNVISSQSKVRVSDKNDSDASDSSDGNFNIRGNLTLIVPVGGEKWPVATNQLVRWNTVGPVQFVGLEYSANNGSSWIPIVASTPNSGTYNWNIPDNLTTQALMKVYDANDLAVVTISPAMFKIQGSFTVISPNGGEAWQAANTYPITWSWNGNVGFVNLAYSKDSGATWTDIALSAANTGTYDWFIPVQAVSTQCRFRVASSADTDAADTSNNDFRVRCTLVLTSPNGTEQFRVGRTYNITWNKVGNPAALTLEYSPDNFLDPMKTQVITTTASSVSPYAWTVPSYLCNTARVRISDTSDPGAKSVSAADFRITGDVHVISPAGAENWEYGSTQNITWSSAGAIANVKIEYSINGGASYNNIKVVANTGSTTWNIPDEVSDGCRIRISDAIDSSANDVSAANFNIIPHYTVTSPDDGTEIWTVGETHPITWTHSGTVANVKLDYSTDAGATYNHPITASAPNNGSYNWLIPDSISTQVKVRVGSALSPAAYGYSTNNFKIRGAFRITAPNGGESWQISQSKAITWVTTGTIANVRILYSIDGGVSFPNTIVNSEANVNTHTWTVPDNRTPSAQIKVVNPADTSVFDDSDANFRIQGYLSLNSPNGGEDWLAGDTHAINWTWGGTMAAVKLSYSTDGGLTYPNIINATAPNGTGGAGNFNFNWTVPNTLTHTGMVKVEDTLDNEVFDVSNANFRINGQIIVTSPVGTERWVTNETHNITWTNKGDIPNVKIIYSKDNFATFDTVVASVANVNSYSWQIPDDRSNTVKVRILDAADETIYGSSPANFRIDYYNISWDIRDLLTNERLTNLSVSEKVTGGTTVGWQAVALTAPLVHGTPYGFWTTVWSGTGFGDKGQNFTADHDQSFTVYLETSAVHIWQSSAEFTYDAISDNLKVTAWLQRDGSVVQGAAKIGIYIYDDTGTPISYNTVCDSQYYNYDSNADGEKDQCNPRPTLFSTTIDPSGYFYMTLPAPTGLQSGRVYAALVDIMNLSGAHFKTPTSFSITESKQLQNTAAAVQQMQNVTLPAFQTGIQNTIDAGINTQKQMITDIMVGTGGDPTLIMNSGGMVGIIQQSMTSFETATTTAITKLQSGADTAVAAGQQLQATAKRFSWNGNVAPDPALTGDTISLQVQGQPSLMPLASIYTWDSKPVVESVIMTETRPGFYVYSFLADTRFTPGKAYTFMVTEQITGGLVSGSGMVESMGITTVAGLAAAAPEAERAAKKALEAIKAVESVLVSNENINISMTLKNLKESVDALPSTLNKEGPNATMMNAINDISARLSKMMGAEGMDFSSLLDEKLGDSSSMKQLRNKTDTISSIVDLLLQIMESKLGGVDSPIVSTSLQSGSVKFRIMAINPSKTRVQKVQVKKYLPEEVKPKDIMDLGGLELEYDSEKGIYYVYKNDLDMQPNQVNVFEVEVEDIWMIPDSQITQIKKRTDEILALFEKTPMYNTAKEITDTIYPVLAEIPKAQIDDTVSREQHIGIYRQNQLNLKAINEKLAELEKMLAPEKGKPTPNILERNKLKINLPTKSTTWLIILVVIIFLGIFAGIFFFVWQGQIKSSQDLIKDATKSSFPGQKPEEKSTPPPK